MCAGIRAGEIVIFDRTYLDCAHMFGLLLRGVFWVTRCKDNVQLRVVKKRLTNPAGRILRDDEVVFRSAHAEASTPTACAASRPRGVGRQGDRGGIADQ